MPFEKLYQLGKLPRIINSQKSSCYGMATIGRRLQIIGVFCRISSHLKGSIAKET